uniref:Putative serine-rich protein n=1 Tax=Schistosoma mansoni TaxID=6183 RepID=A0A3Q0KGL5_SCHMA
MEAKTSEFHRLHRRLRSDEDDKWDCSVCTYINPKESYKCEICHTRKGTSTRKPRLNTQVVEQQQLIAQTILKEKDDEQKKKRESKCKQSVSSNFRFKHFDRSSPLLFEIFANGYSVIITEFQPKSIKSNVRRFSESPAPSNCSSHQGFGPNPSNLADDISSTDSLINVPINPQPHHLSEYEFNDPTDIKPPKISEYPSKPSFGVTRSGPSPVEEPMRPCRSYSPASSSAGGNTLSRASSPPNSIGPCLSDVKKEQAALEAEQAAHDGDDECEEEENIHKASLSTEPKLCSRGTKQSRRSVLRTVSLNSSCSSQNRRSHREERLRCTSSMSPLKRKKLTTGSSRSNCIGLSSLPRGCQSKGRISKESNSLMSPTSYRSLRSSRDQYVANVTKSKKSSKRFKKFSSQLDGNLKPQKRQRFEELPKSNCKQRLQNGQEYEKSIMANEKVIYNKSSFSSNINCNISTNHYTFPDDEPKIHSSPDHKDISCSVSISQTHPRLSTESKNTSAMTDSSGATALEMSS